jgi:chaperonin GroES
MSTKLIPCGDRLLIKEKKAEKKQQTTGLYVPEEKKGIITGTIVAVGPGITTKEGNVINVPFKEGDVVIFSKHMGDKYTHEGEEYLIVNSLEVMCKIEG